MTTDPRMSAAEAVMLCRRAKAACPQQQFDQYTPDMWHELLGDLRYEDANAALVEVVKSQPFVSPAEIREQVKRVRDRRLSKYGQMIQPAKYDNDPRALAEWMREMIQRVGDGDVLPGETPELDILITRPMPNMQELMPRPEPVTRREIAAEKKRAKDPDHERRMAAARAELDAVRQQQRMTEPEPTTTESEREA